MITVITQPEFTVTAESPLAGTVEQVEVPVITVEITESPVTVEVSTAGPQGPVGPPSTKKTVVICPFAANEVVTTGDGVIGFSVSSEFDGLSLTNVAITTPESGLIGGTTSVQIRRMRSGASTDVMTTPVTLISGSYESENGVINGTESEVSTGDILFPDVDSVNITPPNGLFVSLTLE